MNTCTRIFLCTVYYLHNLSRRHLDIPILTLHSLLHIKIMCDIKPSVEIIIKENRNSFNPGCPLKMLSCWGCYLMLFLCSCWLKILTHFLFNWYDFVKLLSPPWAMLRSTLGTDTWIHTNVRVSVCVYVFAYVCVCVYVCCAYVYLYMCVWIVRGR
jgi:hypothetical protein